MTHPSKRKAYGLGRVLLICAVPVACLCSPPSGPSGAPGLTIVLRPAAPGAGQRIPWVDITLKFETGRMAGGAALLKLPLVTSNVETVAQSLGAVRLEDAHGEDTLSVRDDPASDEVRYRHWLTSRAIEGRLAVHYRAPILNRTATRGAAPPLELRSDSGAFSGSGETFLLLPEIDSLSHLHIRWDLDDLAAGSVGVSSFGIGDVDITGTDSLGRLRSSYLMAGNVQLYPEKPAGGGFFSAWHGAAPAGTRELMASEQKLYSFYGNFFKQQSTAPYGIFLRDNPVNAGGGVELANSFVTTFGRGVGVDELTITLAHEMLHTFVGSFDEPGGLDQSWFSEGLAVHYARLLALRAAQITPPQFLADLNTTAGRYYTNAFLAAPNSEIPKRFWADTRIRVLPYDRGSLYFAVVDGQVRARSGGKRSLDDLLLAMLARRRRGLPMDEAAWIESVAGELGERGRSGFQAMLAGALMLPESSAFGPCFARTTKMLRRYELGFDPTVLIESKRIVRGLIPGSAAERAGVRNGDEITLPVPQDRIQAQQEGILTLHILRDGTPLEIGYKPRGEAVEAYQWTRVDGVADRACSF